jgi:PAS domain-containing protein
MVDRDPITSDHVLREVLDALPLSVISVDADRRLISANAAARELLNVDEVSEAEGCRFGDVARCINALGNPAGCGHSEACQSCDVRMTAESAVAGAAAEAREVTLRVDRDGTVLDRVFLLSARPFAIAGSPTRALLFLQDVTDLHRLRGLIPICAGCKKIRRDDAAWEPLERFIEDRSHAAFTHSLCPSCVARLYPGTDATPG